MTNASSNASPTRRLTVIAKMHEHLSPDQIYEEDCHAEGEHTFDVPAHLTDEDAAACALGIYHSLAAIKYLWNFEFVVVDEAACEVEHNIDADIYEHAQLCKGLWVHLKPAYKFWKG